LPERSPFLVIVDLIVAMVAISAASWKKHHSFGRPREALRLVLVVVLVLESGHAE
jgi:hypothetical protein